VVFEVIVVDGLQVSIDALIILLNRLCLDPGLLRMLLHKARKKAVPVLGVKGLATKLKSDPPFFTGHGRIYFRSWTKN
jgi:hypothetical protein